MGTLQAGGDLSAGGEELPSDLDGNSTGGGGEGKQPLSMTALALTWIIPFLLLHLLNSRGVENK